MNCTVSGVHDFLCLGVDVLGVGFVFRDLGLRFRVKGSQSLLPKYMNGRS